MQRSPYKSTGTANCRGSAPQRTTWSIKIMCAKFQNKIFRGYDFTWAKFPIFLLIFAWALQQCSDMCCLLYLHVVSYRIMSGDYCITFISLELSIIGLRYAYTVFQKCCGVEAFAITLSVANRFFKLFHCWKRKNYL